MKMNYVYLEPVHHYAYRRPLCDIPIITGLVEIEPEGMEPRLCFETTYSDGFKDYVPTSEVDKGNYKFVVQ